MKSKYETKKCYFYVYLAETQEEFNLLQYFLPISLEAVRLQKAYVVRTKRFRREQPVQTFAEDQRKISHGPVWDMNKSWFLRPKHGRDRDGLLVLLYWCPPETEFGTLLRDVLWCGSADRRDGVVLELSAWWPGKALTDDLSGWRKAEHMRKLKKQPISCCTGKRTTTFSESLRGVEA